MEFTFQPIQYDANTVQTHYLTPAKFNLLSSSRLLLFAYTVHVSSSCLNSRSYPQTIIFPKLYITLYTPCQILTDLQNSFTITLSSKFAIKKSLNVPPSFTHVATLPCKTVMLKNRKLHFIGLYYKRLMTMTKEQLHNKIICSVNSDIFASD